MQKSALVRKLLEKGVQQVLEEAKVPHHAHMRVVKALRTSQERHKGDIQDWKKTLKQHSEDTSRHEERDQEHEEHMAALMSEIQRIRTLKQGEPGEKGEDGYSPTIEDIVAAVLPYLPEPITGTPGAPGRDGSPGKDAEIDEEALIQKFVKRLQKGDVLHINHIRGAGTFIKDGIRYRVEELMHGGGSSSSSSTGFQAPTSGVVNGVNTAFTFATAPKVLVVDQGRAMQKTSSDGTVNWTGTTSITLTIAPTFDLYATA